MIRRALLLCEQKIKGLDIILGVDYESLLKMILSNDAKTALLCEQTEMDGVESILSQAEQSLGTVENIRDKVISIYEESERIGINVNESLSFFRLNQDNNNSLERENFDDYINTCIDRSRELSEELWVLSDELTTYFMKLVVDISELRRVKDDLETRLYEYQSCQSEDKAEYSRGESDITTDATKSRIDFVQHLYKRVKDTLDKLSRNIAPKIRLFEAEVIRIADQVSRRYTEQAEEALSVSAI